MATRSERTARRAIALALIAVLVIAACADADADTPPAEEIVDRVEERLRNGDRVLHVRLTHETSRGDVVVISEAWIDWANESIRVESPGRDPSEEPSIKLVTEGGVYRSYPWASDVETEATGSFEEHLPLPLLSLSRPLSGEVVEPLRVQRAELEGAPVWRLEQEVRYGPGERDGVPCMAFRFDVHREDNRPLAFWSQPCDAGQFSERDLTRIEVVEQAERASLPEEFFTPPAD